MSLINQVLQDLDRRHADATALPTAAQRVAPARDHERPTVLAGTIGAVLIVGAIATASALVWRQGDAHAAPTAAAFAPAAAPLLPAAPESRGRGDATGFAAIANVDSSPFMAPLPVDARVDVATPVAALVPTPSAAVRTSEGVAATTAVASGSSEHDALAVASASAASSALRPARVAIAGRDEPIALAVAPVQLEKSTPPLSPAERADADYRHGIELHEHARSGDAETAFAAALQHDSRHASARRALAVEWIGRGRTQDAERLLAEGLALNPQQPQLAIVLARIQAERHELRAGIDTLHSSLGGSAAPADQAEALALMATLQQSAGQHRDAADAFAAALRQMPQNGTWWIGLGISLSAEGRNANAREAFDRARATGTLSPELLLYVEQRLRLAAP